MGALGIIASDNWAMLRSVGLQGKASFMLKYNFRNHLSEFRPGFLHLQLFDFLDLYNIVQACTSPKKKFVGILMSHLANSSTLSSTEAD